VVAGAGSVWAIAGDLQYGGDTGPMRLLRIDPETAAVVARIPMRTPAGKRFVPVDVQVDRGAVWAIGLTGALRIDPLRDVADLYVPLAEGGAEPRGVVSDGDGPWVLSAAGGLRRHDARTGRAERALPLSRPAPLFLLGEAPGTLTVLTAKNGLAVIERATGGVVWAATLGADVNGVLRDGGTLWVEYLPGAAADRDRLVRLDADSGRRLAQVTLPDEGVAGMAKVGRDLWVATPGGRIVVVR